MKAYISVDFEGLPFIVHPEQLEPKKVFYDEDRKIATKIANTIVDELHNLGFEEIYIADSHGSMMNIIIDELPDYVYLIRGFPRPYSMMSMVENCNVALLIGYHSKFGEPYAILDHTYSSTTFRSIRINDIEVSEYLLNTYLANYFNVLVILVAGDETLIKNDVENYASWIEKVISEKSLSKCSAISPSLNKIINELRQGIRRAIDKWRHGEIKLLKLEEPLVLEMELQQTLYADVVSRIPGAERIDGLKVGLKVKNIVEAYNIIELSTILLIGIRNTLQSLNF